MILISSSMRVGSTWITDICSCFYKTIPTFIGYNAENIEEYYNKIKDYEIVKDHYLGISGIEKLISLNKNIKIITITRDPKDAFVSYYWYIFKHIDKLKKSSINDILILNFKKEYKNIKDSLKINIFVKSLACDSFLNSWKSFQGNFENKNLLKLNYEEMINNKIKYYKIIESFIFKENLNSLDKVIERTSIEFSRKKIFTITNIKENGNENFYRKGIIGDYKNYLTQDSIDYINEKTGWKDS